MSSFTKYALLLLATSLVFWWAGGLEGAGAWGLRLLVVATAGMLAVHWASVPFRDLERATRRVLGGDFTARLDDVSGGELAIPARAFNEMAESLAKSQDLSREREERVAAVLAASDRAILLLDREGAVVLSSPATLKLFPKFRPESGLASLSLPGLPQLCEEVRSSGAPLSRVLEEGERGMGRIFSAQATPLAPDRLVLYLSDATQEYRLERVKADLVANVSHELRTPLAAMSSLAEALSDPGLSEDKRTHFQERLEFQVHRMQSLVDDLLSLSRLESGQAPLRLEEVDLHRLCEDLVGQLRPAAEAAAVTLEVEVPSGLHLRTDPLLLEVALRNIAENAIRYNKPGGRVTIRATGAGGPVAIRVQDTGEGIPGTHLPRIFERFYRVDPHRSREKGGTGLGLSIVKHAVNRLGGDVSVESTIGVGSTFSITLPGTERGN